MDSAYRRLPSEKDPDKLLGQSLTPGYGRILFFQYISAIVTVVMYLLLYSQTGAWQMLIVAGVIILCSSVFIFPLRAALRRGNRNAAMCWQILAVTTVCAGMELAHEGATVVIATGGAMVILLAGIALAPRQWRTWLAAAGIYAACIWSINMLAPLPRYQYSRLPALQLFHPFLTATLGLLILWHISRAYRKISSIRVRLLVSFVLMVLAPVVIITGCSIIMSFQNGRQRAIEQLESVAALKEAEINTWVRESRNDLRMCLTEEQAPERMHALLRGSPGSVGYGVAYRRLQERFLATVENGLHFEEIFLMDCSGRLVLSSKAAQKDEFRGLQPYSRKGLEGEGTYVQTLSYSSTSEGVNSVVSVCPVVNRDGKPIGVLAGRASLFALNKIMLERTGLGSSGETYLVGSNRILLTGSRFSGYDPGGMYVYTEGVKAALTGHKSGSGFYEGYRKVPVVGVYHWLAGLNVALLAEQNQSEAFQSIYSTLGINLAIALAAALLAVLASLAITRSIAKPVSNLVSTAEGIASGNLDVTARVERDDEIGILAKTFNEMTSRLRKMMRGLLLAKEKAEESAQKARLLAEEIRASNRELEKEILDRKRAETALQEQIKFRLTLRDTIPNPVFCKGVDGIYTECNKAFEDYLALSKAEIIGKTVYDLLPEETAVRIGEQDRRLFANPGVLTYETTLRYADGSDHAIIMYKATYADSEGNTAGLVGVLLDITDRKRAEEEKMKLEAQLLHAKKMESIGILAGGIAHDFNNLLTAITGCGETIRENIRQGDISLRQGIEQIMQAAGRAAELTRSLLVFSRKEAIRPKPVSLNNIIQETSQLICRIIGEDIEFSTDSPSEELAVLADAGQIGQVLMNLATNARDAMPDGGKLRISARRVYIEDGSELMYGLPAAGKYARISVSDTGAGIDEKSMERIFEPFFTTKQVGMGTGLGLSVIHGIIKQHNGSIQVESEIGKGSVFHFYLPLLDGYVTEEKQQADKSVSGGTETLLVAEDESIVAMFMKRTLERAGYTVMVAMNGDEAVAMFEEHKDSVSLVLSDVIMPKKNGKEIHGAIQLIKPGIKVIFVSGYTADIICSKGIAEKEVDFISKPFAKKDLLRKVRNVLDRQS